MYEKKKQLKVRFIGKFKTFSQMISLIILFLGSEIMLFNKIYLIGVICLNFAAIFTNYFLIPCTDIEISISIEHSTKEII